MGCTEMCRGFLAFVVKFLAFLQAFAGVSAVVYASWVIDQWVRSGGKLELDDLSDLWFVCAVMGAGAFICLNVLVGYIASEMSSSCGLCFYALLQSILILLEAAAAGDIFLNKNWLKDLPSDATGELQNFLAFVQNNADVCKGVALSLIVIQALSLFFTIILRAAVSARRLHYDSEEDLVVLRRPLLVAQAAPAYVTGPVLAPASSSDPDTWSSRMRQKYGLSQPGYAYNNLGPSAPVQQ